jgi:mono/diheme cytochrome c family protein
MKQRFPILLALVALAAPAIAVEAPSVQRGKELFTGTQLGTNGKSCAGCHANGKSLGAVGEYDDAQLSRIVNQCITNSLKGKALDPATSDLKSLVMYLKTLTNPRRE